MTYPRLPSIEIIQLPVDRWREYSQLRLTALTESPRSFGESLDQARAHDDTFWQQRLRDAIDGTSWLIFAECCGELVGMAGGYQSPDDHTVDSAGIWGVFVSPAHQGKGIAGMMMTRLLDLLSAKEIRSVHLMVNPEFTSALRLYARFGFSEQRRFQDVMGDGNPGTLIKMQTVLA